MVCRSLPNFLGLNYQGTCCFVSLARGRGGLETRPPVALGSSPILFTFTMSLAPKMIRTKHGIFFWFIITATPLALQLHQERIRMVRGCKEARKRLARI